MLLGTLFGPRMGKRDALTVKTLFTLPDASVTDSWSAFIPAILDQILTAGFFVFIIGSSVSEAEPKFVMPSAFGYLNVPRKIVLDFSRRCVRADNVGYFWHIIKFLRLPRWVCKRASDEDWGFGPWAKIFDLYIMERRASRHGEDGV